MIMHNEKILAKVAKLHATAKNGTLKLNNNLYTFEFDRQSGVYEVTDLKGELVGRFNTRKLSVAKQWVKEWFAD